jgi:hypothetical protein
MNYWVTTFETLKFELGGVGECLLGNTFVAKYGYKPDMKYKSFVFLIFWLLTLNQI